MRVFTWEKLGYKWQQLSCLQRGIIIITIPVTCFAIFPPLVSWNHFDLIEDKEEFYQLQVTNSLSKELLQNTLNAQVDIKNYLLTQNDIFIDSYYQTLEETFQLKEKLSENIAKNTRYKDKSLEIDNFSQIYLTIMSQIVKETEDLEIETINSLELKQWLTESEKNISELNKRIVYFAKEEKEYQIKNNQHLEQHYQRGFALIILFVVVGIFGSLLAVKLFYSLDRELTQKRTELQQINGQLERFTANASHQLRGSLAAILSNAQVGLITPISEPEKINQRLKNIVELTKSNSILVDHLLFLARYESMIVPKYLEEIDLVSFLQNISDQFENLAKDQNLSFTSFFPSSTIISMAEPDLLAQVIHNLLDNATKYTPEGGSIQLKLLVRSSEAVIKVIDSGIGIPEESLDKIFERFYRIEFATKAKKQGFGLGLAIAKEIVRLHKGKLRVHSEVAQGTTFELLLPIIS